MQASRQAGGRYFKKGGWWKEREGAVKCFPYVVHKSRARCSKCRTG